MKTEIEDLDRDFERAFVEIGNSYGVSPSYSRILFHLQINDEISMDDIAKKTGYSLATISNNIRLLENMGIVKRIKYPGSKKIFLRMEHNTKSIIKKAIMAKYELQIKPLKEMLPRMKERYAEADADKKLVMKRIEAIERIEEKIQFFDKIASFILSLL